MEQLKLTASMIPDDMQAELQAAAGLGDKAAWKIGRITNILLDELDAEEVDYSRMSLYKAVAAWAGCASETVRMRAHVQRRFPKWLSEKHEWLGFHQAKALVAQADDSIEKFEILIAGWQDYVEDSGISITSVDGMRAWLHRDNGGPSPELVRYKRLVVQARKLLEMEQVPHGIAHQILESGVSVPPPGGGEHQRHQHGPAVCRHVQQPHRRRPGDDAGPDQPHAHQGRRLWERDVDRGAGQCPRHARGAPPRVHHAHSTDRFTRRGAPEAFRHGEIEHAQKGADGR